MTDLLPNDSPTIHSYKRQRVWQILIPMLVMTALITTAAVMTVTGGTPRTQVWADVSIIWLIIPLMACTLLFLTILIAIIFGISRLTHVTPRYAARAQNLAAQGSTISRKIADGLTKPFFWLQQVGAVIKSFF